MKDELATKTVEILFNLAKGDRLREVYQVHAEVAEAIQRRLDVSYVLEKGQVGHLHKPFLGFTDLDGCTHIIAIEEIRKVKIYTKVVSSQ